MLFFLFEKLSKSLSNLLNRNTYMQKVYNKNIHTSFFLKNENSKHNVLLKNHAIIRTRISWKKLSQSDYTENGPYLIAGKHIENDVVNWNKCNHISLNDFHKSPEIILEENDILFSKDGNLGNPTIIKNLKYDATINSTMMLIRVDETVNPDYFFQIIKSELFERFIRKYQTGSGVQHILLKDVKNFEFPLPNLHVQNKIVKLLSTIDNKMRLLEEKYRLYNNIKNYYMQILIPAYHNTTPIYQNSNKKSKWKKSKIQSIGQVITGNTPSTYNTEYYEDKEGLLWITPKDYKGHKYITDTRKKISAKGLEKCRIIPNESIFVTCIGTIGKVAINKNDCTCNQQVNAIIPYTGFDTNYIYYYIQKNSSRLKYFSNQSVTPILNKNDFMNISISYPDIEEQRKIGHFLSMLDKKIYLSKRNIENLKEFKKNITKKYININ